MLIYARRQPGSSSVDSSPEPSPQARERVVQLNKLHDIACASYTKRFASAHLCDDELRFNLPLERRSLPLRSESQNRKRLTFIDAGKFMILEKLVLLLSFLSAMAQKWSLGISCYQPERTRKLARQRCYDSH